MKSLLKKLFFIAMGITVFASCKKDESVEYFQGGTAPVLSADASTSIPLAYANAAQTAVTFSWTNPGYQFASGVSSQDVSYLFELDTLGANFTNPNRLSLTISKDLGLTLTESALNSYLLNQLVLVPAMSHTIQIRVSASISSVKPTVLVSNILQFTVTPYAIPPAVTPPASGTLVLVGGDSKIGAWSNPVPTSQQFTKVSNTEYKLTVVLSGGDPTQGSDQFLILPVNGDWTHKYACKVANVTSDGGPFDLDLSDNFPGPTAPGTYLIDVNFQTGKYSVTKQ